MGARCAHQAEFPLAVALALFLGGFNAAEAGVITWSGNTFNHTAFGGSGASAGWQAGMQGGSTTDTSGVVMTMQHNRFGTTAVGTNNMTLVPFGGLGNHLRWAVSNDFDGGSAAAVDYSTVTLTFSSAVTVTGFGLRDVDDGTGTSWQDFIAVTATNGASGVGVTYNRSDPTNQQLSTQHGLSGVLGINGVNRTTGDATADVGFSFAGSLTSMTVTFFQGPQGTSAAEHLIYLMNMTITPVPEASTMTMVAVGLGLFGVAAWRKKRRRG